MTEVYITKFYYIIASFPIEIAEMFPHSVLKIVDYDNLKEFVITK